MTNKTKSPQPATRKALQVVIKGAGVGNAASTRLGVVTPQGVKAHINAKK